MPILISHPLSTPELGDVPQFGIDQDFGFGGILRVRGCAQFHAFRFLALFINRHLCSLAGEPSFLQGTGFYRDNIAERDW